MTHAPPAQCPPAHTVPSGLGVVWHIPVAGTQDGYWQGCSGQEVFSMYRVHPPVGSQLSPLVHMSRSSHGVPADATGFEHRPLNESQLPARWQSSSGTHTVARPFPHRPPAHASSIVQALPSLHLLPSVAGGFEHRPVAGSHTPDVWQSSSGRHTEIDVGSPQTPPVHFSPFVQPFPSSHTVPSAAGGFEQAPVDGSHAPAVWQASRATQLTREDGAPHPPAWHCSPAVHSSRSSQAVPSAATGFEHSPVVGSQLPGA